MTADRWQAIANVGNTLSADLLIADLRSAEAEVARLREELADYRAYYEAETLAPKPGHLTLPHEREQFAAVCARIEARRAEEEKK